MLESKSMDYVPKYSLPPRGFECPECCEYKYIRNCESVIVRCDKCGNLMRQFHIGQPELILQGTFTKI